MQTFSAHDQVRSELELAQFLNGAGDLVAVLLERRRIDRVGRHVLGDGCRHLQQGGVAGFFGGAELVPMRVEQTAQDDEILIILDSVAEHLPADAVDGPFQDGAARVRVGRR